MNLPAPGAFETLEQPDGKDTDSANVITARQAVLLQTETIPWEGKAGEKVGGLGPFFLRASYLCCWKHSPECHTAHTDCNQQLHKELSLLTIPLLNWQRIASKAILYGSPNNRWFCGASGLPT